MITKTFFFHLPRGRVVAKERQKLEEEEKMQIYYGAQKEVKRKDTFLKDEYEKRREGFFEEVMESWVYGNKLSNENLMSVFGRSSLKKVVDCLKGERRRKEDEDDEEGERTKELKEEKGNKSERMERKTVAVMSYC